MKKIIFFLVCLFVCVGAITAATTKQEIRTNDDGFHTILQVTIDSIKNGDSLSATTCIVPVMTFTAAETLPLTSDAPKRNETLLELYNVPDTLIPTWKWSEYTYNSLFERQSDVRSRFLYLDRIARNIEVKFSKPEVVTSFPYDLWVIILAIAVLFVVLYLRIKERIGNDGITVVFAVQFVIGFIGCIVATIMLNSNELAAPYLGSMSTLIVVSVVPLLILGIYEGSTSMKRIWWMYAMSSISLGVWVNLGLEFPRLLQAEALGVSLVCAGLIYYVVNAVREYKNRPTVNSVAQSA